MMPVAPPARATGTVIDTCSAQATTASVTVSEAKAPSALGPALYRQLT